MTTITGTAVKAIERALVTDDGSHALFTFRRADDQEHTIALPVEALQGMIMLSSNCLGRAAELKGADPQTRNALVAEDWEMNQDAQNYLVMSLKVAGGGEVSFRLPADSKQRIRELADKVAPRREKSMSDIRIDRPGSKPH